jgi:hypothetical protein
MFADSLADVQLAKLLQVLTLLSIPVGVLLTLLLYKTLFLMQQMLDFVNIARFDVVPMIQDLRAITSHTAKLAEQVDSSVSLVQRSVGKVNPALKQVKSWGIEKISGLGAWIASELKGFVQSKTSTAKAKQASAPSTSSEAT